MEAKANNRTLCIVLKTLGVFLIAFFVILCDWLWNKPLECSPHSRVVNLSFRHSH